MTTIPNGVDPRTLMTLDQFDATLDAHAGVPVMFAATVRELAKVRAARAVVSAHRKAALDVLKAHYAAGNRLLPGGRVRLRMSIPTPVITKRTVPSDRVKKLDRRLWAAARVPAPFVAIKPCESELLMINARAEVAVGELPEPVTIHNGLPRAVAAYQSAPAVAPWTREEELLVDRLRTIGTKYQWDGLPIKFADQWNVGLARLTYDSERLRQIAPEQWEQLAIPTQVGGYVRLVIDDGSEVREDDEDAAE